MKRPITILSATTVGFVGVLALHGPLTASSPLASGPTTTTAPPPSPSTTTSASSSTPSTSVPATSPPTTSAPVSSTATRSAVGKHEYYGYGEMAVKVTVVGTHIVSLNIASLKTAESYSQQLAQQALPILKSEVLQAQGTRISSLTGATYTSEAYAYSIQSALDKLHFK
ncbi:MAG: FMN-binding protein [Acidimicrobiales bacterium]